MISIVDQIQQEFEEHGRVWQAVQSTLAAEVATVAEACINALGNGNKILLFGNGGSAADAQHIAAELTGRYRKDRKALTAIALTTDTSALTAIANDLGFEQIFARQIESLARPGDVLIGISTSGTSANVLKGLEAGRHLGCINIGLTGKGGGQMPPLCNHLLVIPSEDTARIQEMHILVAHAVCGAVEQEYK